MSMAISRG